MALRRLQFILQFLGACTRLSASWWLYNIFCFKKSFICNILVLAGPYGLTTLQVINDLFSWNIIVTSWIGNHLLLSSHDFTFKIILSFTFYKLFLRLGDSIGNNLMMSSSLLLFIQKSWSLRLSFQQIIILQSFIGIIFCGSFRNLSSFHHSGASTSLWFKGLLVLEVY